MVKPKLTTSLGATLVVLSSLCYASYGIWTTLLGDFFGGYTATALRSILVLLLLVPLAIAYRQLEPIDWRRNWRYFAGLLLAVALVWGPFYYAILRAGLGISMAIHYAGYAMGMFFFGRLLAGERFTKDKQLSACLGLIGLALVFSPSVSGFGWLALTAATVSGLAAGAHMVIAKKMPYNSTQTTIYLFAAAVVASIPLAFVLNEPMPTIGRHVEWLYLLIFALASIAALWTLVKGTKLIDAGAAGILGLLEVVFAVLFGVVFFGERPGLMVLLGIAAIIAAAAIPYFKAYQTKA